ncbi:MULTISPECIES: glucose-6-phosphate isomerase [unclassified Oceanobacter]|uniref:glucose-6-phosphate isomerase n=1 Tax=unclassified Oceanobacter TaxID=2620260 RepID=UPI0026E36F7F|nr:MULTISPECIES: glucose-6-phosphate isomerase [unclassified Oceanobacter]MDO6683159.1 glucose-6-phosphate isomerase [Oceanobacter sp. 5_MG-2023]MDP2506520.1 glucose-6-phosphate isomerase [Oceanobacter sp. 3_MG-2023]MDP2549082.1 glucose-6-phosphate isomerase [Oceanobacter sp. 4_MG-2023]MDP2609495.1 glucose-6-phosphate isomerase [Oceanobacter sp. 1_MG-2023]MDP2612805.1 glucose-6-phosphate isomerase [Oceanobacter sp. 2_MG-2023]
MTLASSLTQSDTWKTLQRHYGEIKDQHMLDWFAANPNRFDDFHLNAAGLSLDYSKNRVTQETLSHLLQLAEERQLPAKINAMFEGEAINRSENRPALHTALRNFSDRPVMVDGTDIMPEVRDTVRRMEEFCWKIRRNQWRGYNNAPFTDVVSIGIGGSFLGPKLASNALKPYSDSGLNVHYLANIDGTHITEILKHLNPATTLFIIQSKSFGTQETLKNALACRQWFLSNGGCEKYLCRHFAAVSSNVEKAIEFGIAEENIFPMWDWVGGRYSLWSAIGLPLALAIGIDNFRDMLRGAHHMDEHFRTAPLAQNMPVIMALLGIWYVNFFGVNSHAILPYDHYLRSLPAHLQQLDMESNGKSVTLDGQPVDYHTGPVIWGGVGTNGQHAFHQLLHQGTHFSPCDFIMPMCSHNPIDNFHAMLVSNCLSQSQALLQGKTEQEAIAELMTEGKTDAEAKALAKQKAINGNRPSNTLYFPKTTPQSVGALIALYEHKVAAQGMIWGLNSFDQWGVELGKKLGSKVLDALESDTIPDTFDSSTSGLIEAFHCMQSKL